MIDHKITLYHANWSFCSQMVRVALSEKGLVFKKKHIKLCDQYPEGENINKDFLAINPLATVPAITNDLAVAVKTSVNELLVIATEVSEKLLAIYYSPPKAIANANPAAFN